MWPWSCLGDDSVTLCLLIQSQMRGQECVCVCVSAESALAFQGFARRLSWWAEVALSASVIRTRRYGHRQRRHVSLQVCFDCTPRAAVSGKQRGTSATSQQRALADRLMMPCWAGYYLRASDWL